MLNQFEADLRLLPREMRKPWHLALQ